MGIFRPYDRNAKSEPAVSDLEPVEEPTPVAKGQTPKKGRPTPTRKEAEAARKARVRPTLDKKEANRRARERERENRMKALSERDNTPEKTLLRNMIDSRRSLGEFMLPALVLILALSFLNTFWTEAALAGTITMYAYIGVVIIEVAFMWRRFKRVLAERMPGTTTKGKGLLMYGAMRQIQIRRFRTPKPTLNVGDDY